MQLLVDKRRYKEAADVLAKLPPGAVDGDVRLREFDVEVKLQTNKGKDAVGLAKKAVGKNPDDARTHLWFARVLAADKNPTARPTRKTSRRPRKKSEGI